MAQATQPVKVGDIEFDALITEEDIYEASVPSYPVEEGFDVSDTIIVSTPSISMTLFVTDTPVTWSDHASQGRVEEVKQQLLDLFLKKELVTVVTTDSTFEDMAIASISFSKSLEVGYALEIPVQFYQITKTSTTTTSIPDSYGKSGQTTTSAGTANTSTKKGTATSKKKSTSSSKKSTTQKARESMNSIAKQTQLWLSSVSKKQKSKG